MLNSSLLTLVVIFFVTMLLAGMILLRVKIGRSKRNDPIAIATRRNSIVIIVIILVFLMVWLNSFSSGKLEQEGVSDRTVIILAALGIGSVLLLLVVFFRRK